MQALPKIGAIRKIVEQNFQRRKRLNPSYSLRAYARDLRLRPSELSEFLRGIRSLSSAKIQNLAKTAVFCEPERDELLALASRGTTEAQRPVSLEEFQMVSHWEHFAILAIIESDPTLPSFPTRIAKRLRLSVPEVKAAIERLQKLGWIAKAESGRWEKKARHFTLKTPGDFQALREFNLSMLKKATFAAASQSATERHAASTTICIDPTLLPLAKKRIDQFISELGDELVRKSADCREVFHLNLHFFSLEKGESP